MIPWRFVPLIFKQITRHRVRTLLTAAGITIAMRTGADHARTSAGIDLRSPSVAIPKTTAATAMPTRVRGAACRNSSRTAQIDPIAVADFALALRAAALAARLRNP